MPVAAIIQAILAALSAAPQAIELATKAKDFFSGMFSAGLITADTQNALHARVDADLLLFSKGIPVHWQVQPTVTASGTNGSSGSSGVV